MWELDSLELEAHTPVLLLQTYNSLHYNPTLRRGVCPTLEPAPIPTFRGVPGTAIRDAAVVRSLADFSDCAWFFAVLRIANNELVWAHLASQELRVG